MKEIDTQFIDDWNTDQRDEIIHELLEACKYVASYGTDEGLPSMETFAEMIYQCQQAISKAEKGE